MGELFVILIVDLGVLFIASTVIISLKRYHIIYHTRYLKKYPQNYSPYISVFIPCKGVDEHFEDNLQTFLNTHYQKARLFFIVESSHDLAYPIIKKEIEAAPNAYLVVAGLAKSCGQKNHNLLQAIKTAEERADVYVFLDAYTTITHHQLHDLVLPLSDPAVTVSVGFRWNILREKTLGERLHAFMMALQSAALNCNFVQAVWGGATAIRREDFEKMGVREYWAKTVVDDMTLQQMIQQQRRKAVFVPTCVKETSYPITSVKEALVWFKRQCLYVKFYLRPTWLCMLALFIYISLKILCFPLAVVCAVIYPGKKIVLFTGLTGVFVGLTMLSTRLMKRPANDNHSGLSWLLLSPLYLLLTCWACLLGTFSKVLRWRGIAYHLDYHGTVRKIVRDGD